MRRSCASACAWRARAGRSAGGSRGACASSRSGWKPITNPATTRSAPSSSEAPAPSALPRLELRIERLRASYRFTYAFHAREVRFERDEGTGFQSVFPETFSFHADRHDPSELYLRLDDLWTHPRRLSPEASRRDAEELMLRLLGALPATLAGVLDRLAAGENRAAFLRACEDVAVFTQIVQRFLVDKALAELPRLRLAALHLRRVHLSALLPLVSARVRSEFLARYVRGEVRAESSGDPTDLGFFYALAAGDPERIDAQLLGAAERAYHRWLEDVCLDTENRAFEEERSPFGERDAEVLRTVLQEPKRRVTRSRDLSPFLRRPRDRDCLRLLAKLETWFLRRYDIHHAAAVRHHAESLKRGASHPERRLSFHRTRNYVLALLIPSLPFLAAIPFYTKAPMLFDALASGIVGIVIAAALWLLGVQFMWRKDLTFFYTSVPRIGAGIIVGYLPVFLIDEVWDLAEQPLVYLLSAIFLLGSTTLLYLFVEVQRRLGDPQEAFSRARDIFLLGLIEAAAFGVLVTSLLGPLMAVRNWGDHAQTLGALREALAPLAGELPRVLGVEPFPAFPSAILLMSFLSFFIGTFLQLLWEDLPITEPL